MSEEEVLWVELPQDGLSPHLKIAAAAAAAAALLALLNGMQNDVDRLRAGASATAPAAQTAAGALPQSGPAAPVPGEAAGPPSRSFRSSGRARPAAPVSGAAGPQVAAPAAAAPAARAPAQTGSRAPVPAAPVAAAAPPAARMPSVGAYRYTVQVDDQRATTSQLQVSALREGVRRSVETWAGTRTVTDTGWSGTGARTLASGEGRARCTWAPAVDDLQLPLASGRTWTTSTRCVGPQLTRTETTTTTVKGYDRVLVGGRRVFVWVLERRSTSQVSAQGAVATSHTASSELFAPALGLPVLEVAQVRFPGKDGAEQVARAIRRLDTVAPS